MFPIEHVSPHALKLYSSLLLTHTYSRVLAPWPLPQRSKPTGVLSFLEGACYFLEFSFLCSSVSWAFRESFFIIKNDDVFEKCVSNIGLIMRVRALFCPEMEVGVLTVIVNSGVELGGNEFYCSLSSQPRYSLLCTRLSKTHVPFLCVSSCASYFYQSVSPWLFSYHTV